MRELVQKGLSFVRSNPRILYSLGLLIVIPLAIFLNTWMIISEFEKSIDIIIRSKAILAEDVIRPVMRERIGDDKALQVLVDELVREHNEISAISILRPSNISNGVFRFVASSDSEAVGEERVDLQDTIAWREENGVAYLSSYEGTRFWNVSKAIRDGSGENVGVISMAFSLEETDQLIHRALNRSYIILIITILLVLLLIANQTRLFRYVFLFDRLREIDKMKDAFVSMASHELRSPLTAMKGNVEFLQEKQREMGADEESRNYVDNLVVSINRLDALVNDVLEVSRIEGNRIPITLEAFDPEEIIAQSVKEMEAQAKQKELSLIYKPGQKGIIFADKERLKQIMVNFISNALKYTEKGGVTITTKSQGDQYHITIADTGIGISAEDQKRLFQKFSRIQNKKTQHIIGTGLGLWIVLELINKMNGSVSVESIENVGSHFTVHLPLAKQERKE